MNVTASGERRTILVWISAPLAAVRVEDLNQNMQHMESREREKMGFQSQL